MAFALANEYQEEQILLVEEGKGDVNKNNKQKKT